MKNAMNAAEITDKLGLHSLRQRAWVSLIKSVPCYIYLLLLSTFNPLVLHLEMVFMRVWSGSHSLSERPDTSKFDVTYYQPDSMCFASFSEQSKRSYLNPIILSITNVTSNEPFSSLQRSTSIRGARVVIV